jgi:deazaflavin-dependent oxidoreductase (nitroreductase family)
MKKLRPVALGIVLIMALYILRNHREQVLDRIRFFNKRVINPLMLKIAGIPGSPIAIVGHVGRRSQKHYQTPVIVEPADGSFVFALTYGPNVDWYRNILAAGSGTLRWHGSEYQLEKPEPIDAQAGILAFPPPLRAILQLIGPEHYFKMEIAGNLA